ncbi:hypothetical protein J2W92_005128 [Rhizobium leguminosarum]
MTGVFKCIGPGSCDPREVFAFMHVAQKRCTLLGDLHYCLVAAEILPGGRSLSGSAI